MILRHLEILEAIAQTGTFTGAARKLYYPVSGLSCCGGTGKTDRGGSFLQAAQRSGADALRRNAS